MTPTWFNGRAYWDKEAHQICSDIYAKYNSPVESKASNDEWEVLEGEAIPQFDANTIASAFWVLNCLCVTMLFLCVYEYTCGKARSTVHWLRAVRSSCGRPGVVRS